MSAHFQSRRGATKFKLPSWPKLTIVCHTGSHLITGAVVSRGPRNDSADLPAAAIQAIGLVRFDRMLGDAAFDGEHNHRFLREDLGIRSTVFRLNRRKTGRKWPKTKYRRQMRRRFQRRIYGHRWHVESVFSRHKRRFGSALRARSDDAQEVECLLRVMTHNLMLLGAAP